MKKRTGMLTLLVLFLLLCMPITADAGWKKTAQGTYRYYNTNGKALKTAGSVITMWIKKETGLQISGLEKAVNGILLEGMENGFQTSGADGSRLKENGIIIRNPVLRKRMVYGKGQ